MSIEKLRADVETYISAFRDERDSPSKILLILRALLDEHEESGGDDAIERPDKWLPAEEAIRRYGESE